MLSGQGPAGPSVNKSIGTNTTGQKGHPSKSSVVKNPPAQPSQLGADGFASKSPKASVSPKKAV